MVSQRASECCAATSSVEPPWGISHAKWESFNDVLQLYPQYAPSGIRTPVVVTDKLVAVIKPAAALTETPVAAKASFA